MKSIGLLVGEELEQTQRLILQRAWASLAGTIHSCSRIQFPDIPLANDIKEDLQSRHCGILKIILKVRTTHT
jgi:hypothetical protein